MRTILYLDHTAKLGGGEIALLNLVSALDKTRYRPVVALASDGPLAERLRKVSIETHVIPLDSSVVDTRKDSLGSGSVTKLRQVSSVLRYARSTANWAKKIGADLIHTNSLKSDIYGGIAGRMAGIPVLWHVRDNIDGDYLPGVAAKVFKAMARAVPSEVVANSQSTLRCLQLGPGRGGVVYSGTLPSELADTPEPGTSQNSSRETGATISLIGRIAEWKGQHILIQAIPTILAKYPKTRFLIIGAPLFGEEKYEERIKAMARDLKIESSLEFLGFRNDVTALLQRTDVVVHASTLGEPFGQVVVQGMAAGKPVIATNGGALPEIVLPGKTGLLVPMGDVSALADAVLSLLSDPATAGAMGAAGRERVLERFMISHSVAAVDAIYESVLGGRKKPTVRYSPGDQSRSPEEAVERAL